MEIQKEYEYLKDGRKVVIRRKYKINGVRDAKRDELDTYFKNNTEAIRNSKKLKDALTAYNDSHNNKISYSMFYQKYKSIFGLRKSDTSEEDNNDNQ
jgi:hypothetical protein